MAFKDNKIMPVAFVISEEKILAMCRINVFPIFQSELYGRERRMMMSDIIYSVSLQKFLYLFYF